MLALLLLLLLGVMLFLPAITSRSSNVLTKSCTQVINIGVTLDYDTSAVAWCVATATARIIYAETMLTVQAAATILKRRNGLTAVLAFIL